MYKRQAHTYMFVCDIVRIVIVCCTESLQISIILLYHTKGLIVKDRHHLLYFLNFMKMRRYIVDFSWFVRVICEDKRFGLSCTRRSLDYFSLLTFFGGIFASASQ